MKNLKKRIVLTLVAIMVVFAFTGCTQAERASYNLSKEADNFNNVRQLTVINCIKGDVLFQMTGKMSIEANVSGENADNQLEVIVEDENGKYKKHFIGLSDNVTYIVEDITSKEVSNYKYTLNFNPNMWIPVDVKTID